MNIRVLVANGDEDARRLVERHLTLSGYEVLPATTGQQAQDIVYQHGPQVVIAAWTLPDMSGLELCQAIRSSDCTGFTYFIILASPSSNLQVAEAFDAGVDDFLAAPLNVEELLARLLAAVRVVNLETDLAKERLIAHKTNAELAVANHKLTRVATVDEVTRLINRREALRRLDEQWALAIRQAEPFSCMVFDVDHLEHINATYGYAAGDAVLRAAADVLRAQARTGEAVCRLRGEEFLVLCPGTPASTASVGAERLRRAVARKKVNHQEVELAVTVSAGVAERDAGVHTPEELLKRAEDALRAAKQTGRNRVCVAGETRLPSHPRPTATGISQLLSASFSHTTVRSPVTVLVVDDDPSARALCRAILQREGYEVKEAGDGLEAIASVKEFPPDVIIMDALMPNLDGLECTRHLKADADTREIPIIMVSALTSGEDVEASLETGVDEYITKPFRTKEFGLRVRSMVRLHRGKTELMRANAVRGEQARILAVLLDLSRGLATADKLETMLERILMVAGELTLSRRISIMLPDRERKVLTIADAIGIEPEVASQVRVPVGGAISGAVFLTGKPVVINSPDESPQTGHRYDSKFFASTPLISKAMNATDQVVGVLNITDRQGGRPYDDLELEYVDLICSVAASAIADYQSREASEEARDSIVSALATLAECRDTDTGSHLDRVTGYALILAEDLRANDRAGAAIDDLFLHDLQRAMPLHDIGKVAVPDHILLKPGKLTPAEMELMKKHADIGADTVRSVMARAPGARFLEMAEQIARSHHEWHNGGGYPQGLSGDDIPLAARISALADVYDALTTKRPYKNAIPHEESADIIRRGRGTQFDPAVVDAFCRREQDFAQLARELADDPPSPRGTTGATDNAPATTSDTEEREPALAGR